MPFLLIDSFDNPGLWTVRDPANLPSLELALAADTQPHPHAATQGTMRTDIAPGATGHVIRRNLAPADLTGFSDLTLWYRSTVPQTGTQADGLRLRLRLGSAALPIGAPGNDWHRYLTCARAGAWSYVRMDLADLPVALRAAVTTLEFDITSVQAGHSIWFDGLEARAPATVGDIDSALLAQLDGALVLAGGPVPAMVAPTVPALPAQPFLRLVQYESSHSARRATQAARRGDFTDAGSSIRPAPVPWDIHYRVEFAAATRADQSAMVDFVIDRLGHRRWLATGNQAVRLEQVPTVLPDDAVLDGPVIRYRAGAWSEPGGLQPVLPVSEVAMNIDRSAGGAG